MTGSLANSVILHLIKLVRNVDIWHERVCLGSTHIVKAMQ